MAAAAADPPPPPPPGPPPPRPPEDKLFCPWQDSLEDIPVYEYDIAYSPRISRFLLLQYFMKSRQKKLAPFTVGPGEVPVTPIENPKTCMSSHYIIRLVNGQDETYSVDCLIRDTDLYFVGFRRRLVLSAEEELRQEQRMQDMASSSKKKKRGKAPQGRVSGWGTWYRFSGSNMEVPAFLHAQNSGIRCSYGSRERITPGGFSADADMLRAMATFQDNPVPSDGIVAACNRFMTTICEPSRLRCMYREMMRRISRDMKPGVLSKEQWDKIGNWTQLGREALENRVAGRMDPNAELPEWCDEDHDLQTVDDLVGPRGELRLINHDLDLMGGITPEEIEEIAKKAGKRNTGPACRKDPGI